MDIKSILELHNVREKPAINLGAERFSVSRMGLDARLLFLLRPSWISKFFGIVQYKRNLGA